MAPTWGSKRFWRAKGGGRQEPAPFPSPDPRGESISPGDRDGVTGQSGENSRTQGSVVPQPLPADPRSQRPANPGGTDELPQEDGFLGLYIRVLLWQSRLAAKECTERVSPYSNRLGFYRPLDVVKIGEGASFTVSKRHDQGSAVGRASNLVVMKDSKARFEENGMPRAGNKASLQSLLSEIDALSHSALRHHPNIVRLLDIRWDHPSLEREQLGPTLYLEYAQLGTLSDFRAANHDDYAESQVAQSIMLDICLGLEALHQCGITHGDVKPSNILLFNDGWRVVAKLSDFGGAIFVKAVQQGSTDKIVLPSRSPPWDAPETGSEVMAELAHKSDIYSFGLVYWWYRRDVSDRDPFGLLQEEGAKLFGFKGDMHTKMDAFKSLKQSDDLGLRMYQAILDSSRPSGNPQWKDAQRVSEASVVGQATLSKDPSQRTLKAVKDVIASTSQVLRRTDAPDQKDFILDTVAWRHHHAWTLPLNPNPLRPEPAHRFLEVLKSHASNGGGSLTQQIAVLVLIFRCYAEGYGHAKNVGLSARYLRDAAQLGDCTAQATASLYRQVYGLAPLDAEETSRYLYKASSSTRDYFAMKDKLADQPCVLPMVNMANHSAQLTQFNPQSYSAVFEELRDGDRRPGNSEADALSELVDAAGDDIVQRYRKVQTRYGGCVVHYAADHGWIRLLEALFREDTALGCRESLTQPDGQGLTPLLLACKSGCAEVILFLLDNGAVEATNQTAGPATSILNYLTDLQRDASGHAVMLDDIAQKMVRAGANPNARPADYRSLAGAVDGTLDPLYWDRIVRERALTPLGYAIWMGDAEVVKCLLKVGAIPDAFTFHLAAGLHQVDVVECLVTHRSYSFSQPDEYKLGEDTLFDAALRVTGVCSTHIKRIMVTRAAPAQSAQRMVEYLLSKQAVLPVSADSPSHGHSSILHICRNSEAGSFHHETLRRLVSFFWAGTPTVQWLADALTTAVAWNNVGFVGFLLSGSYTITEAIQAQVLHACAVYPGVALQGTARKLIEDYKLDIKLGFTNKTVTDLERPFQIAIACQNFEFANYLVQNGGHGEQLIAAPASDRLQERTLLGWLMQITWSESQHRIRYLFEEYPREAAPGFIVMPRIGRSALQQAACLTPANEWNEQDAKEMMRYLIDRYPGSRHLEYQRVDKASEVRQDTSSTGYTTVTGVDGRTTVVKNQSQFRDPMKDYEATKEKEHNGVALHHAVRAINFPAVETLLEAGAEASAMIGLPLPVPTASVTRKPSSTYAVKDNLLASTVLDFAMLVKQRLDEGIFPASAADRNPSTLVYLKRRSADIVELLINRGASTSISFVGRSNEEKLYKERREKGNIAAMRMFGRELRSGLHQAKEVGKAVYKDAVEVYKEETKTPKQTQEEMENDHATELHLQGRLMEAAALLEKALASKEGQPGGNYDELTFTICLNLACVYSDQGKQAEARETSRRALEGLELTQGKDGRLTLSAAHNLAAILADEGNDVEAEPIYLRALHGRKKVLGPDDPETLRTLSNLASTYSRLGRYEAADEAFERALRGQERSLGTEDRKVLDTVQALGHHYTRCNRHDEAKAMMKRAAAGREKALGPGHMDTLTSVHALAGVLTVQGEHKEAAGAYERARRGFQEALGPEHPSTTTATYNLGLAYLKLDRPDDAGPLLELAMHNEQKRLGPEHATTLLTVLKLANAYKDREQYAEAERLYLRVLAAREASFGPEDSLVRNASYQLGLVYHAQQRLDEATGVFEVALRGEEAALGPDHNDTLYTAFELAKVYKKLERYDEAQTLFLRSVTGREKRLGARDFVVRLSRFNLGIIYQNMGDLDAAAAMFDGALRSEEQTLGPEHLETLVTLAHLAGVQRLLKRYDEAEGSYRRLLAGREAKLGPNDRLILNPTYNLGLVYKAVSKYDDAASCFRRAMEGYERLLGPNDEEVLEAADQVADMLKAAGRHGEALDLCEMTLRRRRETLGADHADTIASVNRLLRFKTREQNTEPAPPAQPGPSRQPPLPSSPTPVLPAPATPSSSQAPLPYPRPGQQPQIDDDIAQLVASFSRQVSTQIPAVPKWDLDSVQHVLSGELGVDARDSHGLTPLLWAAKDSGPQQQQQPDTATETLATPTQLLDQGADIHAVDRSGQTALHLAARSNDACLVRLLLHRGALSGARDAKSFTPLHAAVAADALDAVRTLLLHLTTTDVDASGDTSKSNNGISSGTSWIEAENSDGYTALHLAAKCNNARAAALLLEHGGPRALAAVSGRRGVAPLHLAADLGHADVLAALLPPPSPPPSGSGGAEAATAAGVAAADALSAVGLAPLHYAAAKGHELAVRVLIARSAAIDLPCAASGWTPLLHAAAHGHEAAAQTLLDSGAAVHATYADGAPALHVLAARDAVAGVRLLIENGADLELQQRGVAGPGDGTTAIFCAAAGAALGLLLECGAETGARDARGGAALHHAAARGDTAAARLLVDFGAEVDAVDVEGLTPLHVAAGEGREEVVRLLLASGADGERKSLARLTALQVAAMRNQAAVMTLLILGPGAGSMKPA